jgi:trans-aconitate 2-methyltransferase
MPAAPRAGSSSAPLIADDVHGPVPWDAQAYDNVAMVQYGWGLKVLARRAWRGNEAVLDAGCGPGRLTEALLQRVPDGRVHAVDLDPTMVAAARVRLAPYGPRATVHEANLVDVRLPAPVDVVFCNAVLHWVPDHDAVFQTFHDLLRPGGELLLQAGGAGNLDAVRASAARVLAQAPFAPHFTNWQPPWRYETAETTHAGLVRAGFPHPDVRLDPDPIHFHDEAPLRRFLRAVVLNPYLRQLPPDAHLQDAFVDAYLEAAADEGDPWTLDYVRLNVQARRSLA